MDKDLLAIPEGVEEICEEEYAGQLFSEVTFPSSLKKIGDRAFADCVNLKRVWISENVGEIGREAFAGCKSIRKVFLPKSVKTIGEDAFDYENCEIFGETGKLPKGWFHYTFRDLGYSRDERTIVTYQDSWCSFDIDWEYPEYQSDWIPYTIEPDSVRIGMSPEEVRQIWDQEEWVLQKDTRKRRGRKAKEIYDERMAADKKRFDGIEQDMEEKKKQWEDTVRPYKDSDADIYPAEILPVAEEYIEAMRAMQRYYAGKMHARMDYEIACWIFDVYCELVPRFKNKEFAEKLTELKRWMLGWLGYIMGGDTMAKEEKRIKSAYEKSMEGLL